MFPLMIVAGSVVQPVVWPDRPAAFRGLPATRWHAMQADRYVARVAVHRHEVAYAEHSARSAYRMSEVDSNSALARAVALGNPGCNPQEVARLLESVDRLDATLRHIRRSLMDDAAREIAKSRAALEAAERQAADARTLERLAEAFERAAAPHK